MNEIYSLINKNEWSTEDKTKKDHYIKLKDNAIIEIDDELKKNLIYYDYNNIIEENKKLKKNMVYLAIYNFINKTSLDKPLMIKDISDSSNLNSIIINKYSDQINNIFEIIFYLVKNKFIYKKNKLSSENIILNKNKNIINPLYDLLENCSSEEIIENLVRVLISDEENLRVIKNPSSSILNEGNKRISLPSDNFNELYKTIENSFIPLYNYYHI